jgi:hypothetical protein
MQVDRHIQCLSPRQDRRKPWIVEEQAIGGAVHQHAAKGEVADRTLQLVRRRLGRQQRQMCEAAVTVGVAGAGLGQRVVVGPCEFDAGLSRHQVRPRPATDSTCMLMPLASMSAIRVTPRSASSPRLLVCAQTKSAPGKAAAGNGFGQDAGHDAGHGEVFFQGDDAHFCGSLCVTERGLLVV